LTREVGEAWRVWRAAVEKHESAASASKASASEREFLESRRRELAALGMTESEWSELSTSQSRLANAASLVEIASQGSDALAEGDDALITQLAQIVHRLEGGATHDPTLRDVIALVEPAAIQLEEAARALRDYLRRLDVDPGELARVEARLASIHDTARKYRVRPEALPALLAETDARMLALAEAADESALARRAAEAEQHYRALAKPLSAKRRFAANELAHRVTEAMQELAMAGGRLEVELVAESTPASHGLERVELRVASHPKQALGPLARVASGGELSRIALAIQVVTSEVGNVPTLIFDEVDTGIGGAVAATVGRQLQALGARRQVLCVTHLAQVAAHADHHFRVAKLGNGAAVATALDRLKSNERVDELARMLSGSEITVKTRAHAKELFAQHRRVAP
jgi:DNA repair protein RecN (Recombination protein N)